MPSRTRTTLTSGLRPRMLSPGQARELFRLKPTGPSSLHHHLHEGRCDFAIASAASACVRYAGCTGQSGQAPSDNSRPISDIEVVELVTSKQPLGLQFGQLARPSSARASN